MGDDKSISGCQTNDKGEVVTIEIYDRGTYIETITKVDHDNGKPSDYYVEKEPKK
ncbi:hypothetical protein [Youngiibacter multivorans]|uniref:Uncharacterized protein n=1 Tax=Youngiibacter multivorans TaxID=937251 RepID=A0ABS4FZY5_9CLOT|nr:hypothetical protein [Youngiibacter multivorans]MBP1917839.1 hypothetical protein [Youngiibacter multivorans]